MADDKKNIPEAAPPAEAPAPAVENAAVPVQPAPEPVLTDAEAVMLEHEGQAALFEMGETVPDPADAVTHAEVEEPAAPEVPKAGKEQEQPPAPGKDDPAPAHSGKVVDFAAARDEAVKEEKKAVKQKPPTEKDKAAKPGRSRPPKDFLEVSDEIVEAFLLDKRAEAARDRKMFRYKAFYSLDCNDGIENAAIGWAQPAPEDYLIEKEELAEYEELIRRLYEAISSLPPMQARRVHARYMLGMKVKDIAAMEGITPSQAGKSIHAALRRLRRYFARQKWTVNL